MNDMINRGGITFSFRAQEATGASPDQIARAYTVVREVFGLSRFWASVESAGVPVAAATALHLEGRRLLDRAVRWLLQSRQAQLDVAAEISRFQLRSPIWRRAFPNSYKDSSGSGCVAGLTTSDSALLPSWR